MGAQTAQDLLGLGRPYTAADSAARTLERLTGIRGAAMTTTTEAKSAAIRARLDHPVIDGDSHIVEFVPAFLDALREEGGSGAVAWFTGEGGERFRLGGRQRRWLQMSWEERRRTRATRPAWWTRPTKNTLDRATAMLPRLYYERLDELGLDFMVLYPTLGLGFCGLADDDYRPLLCRAFNRFAATYYGEFADRMTVAATIPLHTPEEGIAELEHAAALGLKVALIPSFVRRPVAEVAERHPDLAQRVEWLDTYGIDSAYDYDPFWAKSVELGFAVAAHSGTQGLPERSSISNYMYNHMGQFAAGGEMLAKSLLLGGVTRRFPTLRVALLEGGVANGCRLYADVIERWKKRNPAGLENYNPANLDLGLARDLFQRYGGAIVQGRLAQLEATLDYDAPAYDAALRDDFAALGVTRPEDFRDLFIPHFYFGCEADDPITAWAFDRRGNPFGAQVRAILSTDLGHWDVPDMRVALAEAYELVEDGRITADDFRDLAFTNQVTLYAGGNPNFFAGTLVEREAAELLAKEKRAAAR